MFATTWTVPTAIFALVLWAFVSRAFFVTSDARTLIEQGAIAVLLSLGCTGAVLLGHGTITLPLLFLFMCAVLPRVMDSEVVV